MLYIFLLLLASVNFCVGFEHAVQDEGRFVPAGTSETAASFPWIVKLTSTGAYIGTGAVVGVNFIVCEYDLVFNSGGIKYKPAEVEIATSSATVHHVKAITMNSNGGPHYPKNAIGLIRVCPSFLTSEVAPMPPTGTLWAPGAAVKVFNYNSALTSVSLVVADDAACVVLSAFDTINDFCTTADASKPLLDADLGCIAFIDSTFAGFNTAPSNDGSKPEQFLDIVSYIPWMKDKGVPL